MKALIITLLTFVTTISLSQNTFIWTGGTPGKETKWSESGNWSNNQVPDENSFVIIKAMNTGHGAQPVVKERIEAASIEIQAGATLTVTEKGEILIDGSYTYSAGIVSYGGELINQGVINLVNIEGLTAGNFNIEMQGKGLIFVDSMPLQTRLLAKE